MNDAAQIEEKFLIIVPTFPCLQAKGAADAKFQLRTLIEKFCLGASDIGGTFPIRRDSDKSIVAYISYNGRLWTTEKKWQDRKSITTF